MGYPNQIRWNPGHRPVEVESGSEVTLKQHIEEVMRQVNTARYNKPDRPAGVTSLVIHNALCQAALCRANRWQGRVENGETAQETAVEHRWLGGDVEAVWAHGATDVQMLTDALLRDKKTAAVVDDPKWGRIGAAVGGSPYNLVVFVFFGQEDPTKTIDLGQEVLEQLGLRDGTEYGDPALLAEGAPERKIVTGVG